METGKEKLETMLLLFTLARKPACGTLLKSLTLCAGSTIPIMKKKKRKMFGGSCYMQVLILGLKERSFHSLWPQFSQPYGSSNIWRGPVKD